MIKRKRRLGMYSSWFGYSLTTEEQMRLIKEAGFDNVCFWWGSEGYNGPKEDQVIYARKYGLNIENIHMPYVWAEREINTNPTYKYASSNDFWADNEDGKYVFDRTLECLEECADHEISVAVTHIMNGYNPHPVSDFGIDRIKRIIDFAEKKNVIIAVENTHGPVYVDSVFKSIKSDKLRFCYDSGHDRIWGDDFTRIIRDYGSLLVGTHLHDNFGEKDDHLIPGDGNMDFSVVKNALLSAGFEGDLMFEIMALKETAATESADEYLRRAYASVSRIFADML